jgi:hypothetical protein
MAPPSRKDLAAWASDLSGETVTSQLKELSTGVVLCRLLESGRPGSIETRKMMTSTRSEADAVTNLKLFSAGLEKLDPTGEMAAQCEVENVARGQPQATLRLMQLVFSFLNDGDASSATGSALAPIDGNARASGRRAPRKPAGKGAGRKGKSAEVCDADEEAPPPTPCGTKSAAAVAELAATLDPAIAAQLRAAQRRQEELQGLREERDFYLTKLRLIEAVAEDAAAGSGECTVADRILQILHCREDEVGALGA